MIGEAIRDGVVIGMLLGLDEGRPLVVFAGNPSAQAVPARSLVRFGPEDIGAELALLFEDGDPGRPLVIGRIVSPMPEGLLNAMSMREISDLFAFMENPPAR
ncbi:MAG TPA: DUF6484 domain-containing protein [Paracoccus sp. (in: a-proteobacteria)]|nr:DUF6484 domain-containing protein [Paracoccus sp. (in: a-proteobacteria)]